MIRISYPKEKITKLGLETKAYCIKLSSAKFDVISLVDKILTHLDEETEFYYRATGTYSELNDLKKGCEDRSILVNEYYKEKSRHKNRHNMEICSMIFCHDMLTTLLMNWSCTPTQEKNIFVTTLGGGERIVLTLHSSNRRYDLLKSLWPYLLAYVECDPYAKWNTFIITIPIECKEKVDSILQTYKLDQHK